MYNSKKKSVSTEITDILDPKKSTKILNQKMNFRIFLSKYPSVQKIPDILDPKKSNKFWTKKLNFRIFNKFCPKTMP